MFTWGYIMTTSPGWFEAASFSQEPVELYTYTLRCQHGQLGKLRTKLVCQYISMVRSSNWVDFPTKNLKQETDRTDLSIFHMMSRFGIPMVFPLKPDTAPHCIPRSKFASSCIPMVAWRFWGNQI